MHYDAFTPRERKHSYEGSLYAASLSDPTAWPGRRPNQPGLNSRPVGWKASPCPAELAGSGSGNNVYHIIP
eukprot:scaffold31104_cov31-Prasinocladus_malaysianus.AAC.1